MNILKKVFAPAPEKELLPPETVAKVYPGYRRRVLEATFLGYAMYYFCRNNMATVADDMNSVIGMTSEMYGGLLFITSITYGLGKFLMGALSDRSNPRVFMAVGLALTALVNLAFGFTTDYNVHYALWALNGLVQGMGWPPCGRSMGHWYSVRERGFSFSIWNTSHNFGGAIGGWIAGKSVEMAGGENFWYLAFVVPAVICLMGSVYLFFRLVDTPQSVGLPPVEVYKQDFTEHEKKHGVVERNLTWKELFLDNVFLNPWIWILSIANFFAYICRYSMLEWGPSYIRQVHENDIMKGTYAIVISEVGGIIPTILLGWYSDRLGGRRGLIAVLCMIPIIGAFWGLTHTQEGQMGLAYVYMAIVSIFIYPVINLIVIMAMDFTSKKAIGVAAGFIGLFGYFGKACSSKYFGGVLGTSSKDTVPTEQWGIILTSIAAAGGIAFVMLMFTAFKKPKA